MNSNQNSEEKYIYVVSKSVGEYEDKYDYNLIAFDTEEAAQAYIDEQEHKVKHIEDLAIKNDIWDDYGKCSYEYSKLYSEYERDLFQKLFPRFVGKDEEYWDNETLTDEESDIYDEVDDEVELKKYMLEHGYSEEVADATVLYNLTNRYEDNNPYYSYDKIKLVESKH